MSSNTPNTSDSTASLVFSFLTLRQAIGWLGVVFPFLLVIGAAIYSGGGFDLESSISHYYYTGSKHIFGGVLFVVAFFLFAYKGYRSDDPFVSNCKFILCRINLKDDVVGNAAGVFAIGVVLFPTAPSCEPTGLVGTLHFVFAASFFLCLIYFALCLFTRSREANLSPRKKTRNTIYKICGYTMLLCILLIPALKLLFSFIDDPDVCVERTYVFWLESIALWAFGASWLVKGEVILKDVAD